MVKKLCLEAGLFVGVLFLLGCTKQSIHPGTGGAIDSSFYSVFAEVSGVIDDTTTHYNSGDFDKIKPQVKEALNILINSFNVADKVYCDPPSGAKFGESCSPTSYHAMALAGTATQIQVDAMQIQINDLQAKEKALLTVKG